MAAVQRERVQLCLSGGMDYTNVTAAEKMEEIKLHEILEKGVFLAV